MAAATGTIARLKNGGAWTYFPGGAETAVEAFGPGVEIVGLVVGGEFELETLAAVSAPTINQPDPIIVTQGTGFTDSMAARVSGGVPPYTFSQVPAAPLPLGVTITAGGNLTGSDQFSVGSYGWSVRVTDSRMTDGEPDPQSATINYSLTVEALPVQTPEWEVPQDGRVILNNITPDSGMVSFTITEPAAYAGTYTVDTAQFAAGPICLAPATVTEALQNPGFIVAVPGLWVTTSDSFTLVGQWFRDEQAIPNTGLSFDIYPAYEIDTAADGGKHLFYRETATDANGARSAQQATGYYVESEDAGPTPDPDGWYQPVWKAGPTSTGSPLAAMTYESNGDVVVGTGGNYLNPRAYFDVVPGKTYQLETNVEYGTASRIIGRLSDATGMNNALNVPVFDVSKGSGITHLVRTDTFTPTTDRVSMHYVFTMGNAGASARILAATRVREIV